METTNKNIFESMADMQKKAVDNLTQVTNNMKSNMFTGNNTNFDSETFKKWYDSQMAWFNNANGENKNPVQAFEFFNTWMNNQISNAKTWFDNNNNPLGNMGNNDMNASYYNMMNLYNEWTNTMNNSYSEMMKNFDNKGTKENFASMFNNAEMQMKAFEFFMPMMNSIQDKTFTPDMFKQMFNTPVYKEMMDKMFGTQPDWMKNMMENPAMTSMKDNMTKMMGSNKSMFDNMKGMMNTNMPNMNDSFANMMGYYNQWNSAIDNASAPFTKLMGNTKNTVVMSQMREISDMMMNYNVKNTQMQFMTYQTGLKAMEDFSETLYATIQEGKDMSNFTDIYSAWLNTNDKHFVKLYETEDYSKMMSEVSGMQLTLKKKIEASMEKSMEHLPLINRTEMDELYKTIYELKKRINMLESQLDVETTTEATEASSTSKTSAKKSAKNA